MGMDMNIEMAFADIDADVSFPARALFGQFLTLHTELAPYHLFRTRAEGRNDQALPRRRSPRAGTVPFTRPGMVAAIPGHSQVALQKTANATCKG